MYQISTFSALGPISGHQDETLRHDLTEYLAHFRVSCPNYSTHITVVTVHAVLAPFCYHFSDPFIYRPSVSHPVLQFAAGRIRSFNKHEYSLVLSLAHIYKRLYSVASKIRINRSKILFKAPVILSANGHMTEMSLCICSGCRAYIASLYITDNYESLFLAVLYCLIESNKSVDTEYFIHCYLRLYGRHQVTDRIHDSPIEIENSITNTLRILTELFKRCL